jgi:hypothetical protein
MLNVRSLDEEPINISVETIERRNKRLKEFFHKIFPEDEVMIIGNANKPSVIRIPPDKNAYCISCFVSNFTLIFTDKPFKGEHVYSVTLTEKAINTVAILTVLDVIKNTEHRPVYQIQEKNSGLLLSGYNFIDRTNEETKYPVFSKYRPKIYFNLEHAETLASQFDDYELHVVS